MKIKISINIIISLYCLFFLSTISYGYQNITITPIVPSLISSDHTSEGFMVTLNSGKIIHFFRLDPGSGGNHTGNNGRIVKRYSIDNGLTWSPNILVYDDQFDDRNINGGLLGNGRIVLTFRRINVYSYPDYNHIDYNIIYSDDDGVTWSPRQVISSAGVASDTHNIVYVPTKGYMNQIMNMNYVELRFSNDGSDWSELGYIWDYRTTYQYYISEACFTYTKDGKLIGLMRNEIGNYFQVSSNDYGTTWTEPKNTNIANGHFCPSPLIFYDKDNDDVWVIATDRRGGNGPNILNKQNKIWIYVSKIDSIINNPNNWTLVDTLPRPLVTTFRLYGYTCATKKKDGNYLIVFTESTLLSTENATFYQFEINYNISTQLYSDSYLLTKQISQNYPNPVNSQTTIDYFIPEKQVNSLVKINVYNEIGTLVYTYSNPSPTMGKNSLILNTSTFRKGIYFYGFENSLINDRMKMLVL